MKVWGQRKLNFSYFFSRQLKSNLKQKAYHASAYSHPSLDHNVFSRQKAQTPISELPKETYPNPLFQLDKKDIAKLDKNDYAHLLSLPYKDVTETDQFCANIAELVHENLLKDPQLAHNVFCSIQDADLRALVLETLLQFYEESTVRRCLVLFMNDPLDPSARKQVFDHIKRILLDMDSSGQERVDLVLSFLRKLALACPANSTTLLLNPQMSNFILAHLRPNQKSTLFAYMIHINMKFGDLKLCTKLMHELLAGSPIEKLVARTGIIDAKLHHMNSYAYTKTHLEKIKNFFTFPELEFFTEYAIKHKQEIDAGMYLDLAVQKLEDLSLPNSLQKSRIQKVLGLILEHSMSLKGPEECIKYLQYMRDSKLEIRAGTLLRILTWFRKGGYFNEALVLINFIHDLTLMPDQRDILIAEIMQLMTSKFDTHPKVAIGYFASIFDDPSQSALHLLGDLGLLQVVYGAEAVRNNFDAVEKADIHQDLTGCKPKHSHLQVIYDCIFRSLPLTVRQNDVLIRTLYKRYHDKIVTAQKNSIFHPSNIDDTVVKLMLEQLLKENPNSDSNKLTSDKVLFQAARDIAESFFSIELTRSKGKIKVVELLIKSSLLQHSDLAFATETIKYSRSHSLPLTFNQLYPFVLHHYNRNQYTEAEQWYMLMVTNGVHSRSSEGTQLQKIAKELGWQTKGGTYRRFANYRNQQIQKKKGAAAKDPLSINTDKKYEQPVNLMEELGRVLGAKNDS